jgi:hypothetical protein
MIRFALMGSTIAKFNSISPEPDTRGAPTVISWTARNCGLFSAYRYQFDNRPDRSAIF